MKVRVRSYKLAGEPDKTLEIDGVNLNSAAAAEGALKSWLAAAKILWPEMGDIYLSRKKKKTK